MADKTENTVTSWEKLGIAPTSITQVPAILDLCWGMEKKITVCLVGETGIGKTPIVHQWVKKKKGYLKTVNFGHMTQEEVSMIMFNEDGTQFDFVPPSWLLRLNEEAEKKGCAVLFLDEWNRGDKALVNALFTLTDERRIHDFTLHKNVLITAAMNPSDGAYLVNEAEKDHAIRKRLCFVYTTHDITGFIRYTKEAKWHPLVPDFIKSDTVSLYDVKARDAGKCFPCPANWEKVSNILLSAVNQKIELHSPSVDAMVTGQIGSATANRFMEFVRDQNVLIRPVDVLHDYKGNSKTRTRVKALLSGANKRHDVISNLNEGVAIELFSTKPDPAVIAESLANYMADLPSDLLGSFTGQNLYAQSQEHGDRSDEYLGRLTQAMSQFPQYKARMKEIVQTINEYRNKAKEVGEDPIK